MRSIARPARLRRLPPGVPPFAPLSPDPSTRPLLNRHEDILGEQPVVRGIPAYAVLPVAVRGAVERWASRRMAARFLVGVSAHAVPLLGSRAREPLAMLDAFAASGPPWPAFDPGDGSPSGARRAGEFDTSFASCPEHDATNNTQTDDMSSSPDSSNSRCVISLRRAPGRCQLSAVSDKGVTPQAFYGVRDLPGVPPGRRPAGPAGSDRSPRNSGPGSTGRTRPYIERRCTPASR